MRQSHTPSSKIPLAVWLLFSCLSIFLSCTSTKQIETRADDTPFKVSRLQLLGFSINEQAQQVFTAAELEDLNAATIATAKAEAKAKTIGFDTKRDQDREDLKQDTAKFLSWGSFILAGISIFIGVITQGYLTWGLLAGAFFLLGTTAIILPELSDYLKWVILGGGAFVIIKGMSHSKHFSISNVRAPFMGAKPQPVQENRTKPPKG